MLNGFARLAGVIAVVTMLVDMPCKAQSPCIPVANAHLTFAYAGPYAGSAVVTPPTTALSGMGDFTIECWLKLSTDLGYHSVLSQFGSATSNNPRPIDFGTLFGYSYISINWGSATPTTHCFYAQGSTLLFGTGWRHLALVRQGGAVSMYVDGVVDPLNIYTDPCSDPLQAANQPLYIGGSPFGSEITGGIDELRVWTYARTQQQLLAAKNFTVPGTETGLLACWRFDEGSGSLAANSAVVTGTSLDGVLTGIAGGSPPIWQTAPSVQAPISNYCAAQVQLSLVPKAIKLSSNGTFVTALVTLLSGDSAEAITPTSIRITMINGVPTTPVLPTSWIIQDQDGDGVNETLMLRFNRSTVASLIHGGLNQVTVSGSFTTGALFDSADTIRGIP